MRTLILPICALMVAGCSGNDGGGHYSFGAVNMWEKMGGGEVEARFTSPDKSWTLTAAPLEAGGAPIRTTGRLGALEIKTMNVQNAELVWAPDSSGAFLNGSDGGNIGNYHLHVLHQKGGQLMHTDLTPMIRARFGHPVKCFDPEAPNVAGVKWLDANRIVVAAEVMPHSNCDNMGTFTAYVVDLRTMAIETAYDQLEAKRLFWRDLGRNLRNAEDDCIRKPGACEIPALHGRAD